jgi:hypothetical protein
MILFVWLFVLRKIDQKRVVLKRSFCFVLFFKKYCMNVFVEMHEWQSKF